MNGLRSRRLSPVYALVVPFASGLGLKSEGATDPCECLNWKHLYSNNLVECGRGLERVQTHGPMAIRPFSADTPDAWMAGVAEHADEWKALEGTYPVCTEFYEKMDDNVCVKASFEESLATSTTGWWASSWCYVSAECSTVSSQPSRVPDSKYLVKLCEDGQHNDRLLSHMRAEDIADLSAKTGIHLPFLAHGAFPIESRPGADGTEFYDVKSSNTVVVVERDGETFLKDTANIVWAARPLTTATGVRWWLEMVNSAVADKGNSSQGPPSREVARSSQAPAANFDVVQAKTSQGAGPLAVAIHSRAELLRGVSADDNKVQQHPSLTFSSNRELITSMRDKLDSSKNPGQPPPLLMHGVAEKAKSLQRPPASVSDTASRAEKMRRLFGSVPSNTPSNPSIAKGHDRPGALLDPTRSNGQPGPVKLASISSVPSDAHVPSSAEEASSSDERSGSGAWWRAPTALTPLLLIVHHIFLR